MDSKKDFFKPIKLYYSEISKGSIQSDLLDDVSSLITDYYYEQYLRFGIMYPKSIKRYSSFQIKDLDHPSTFGIVINFFKKKFGNDYQKFSKILLKMNDAELYSFEKNREAFNNK